MGFDSFLPRHSILDQIRSSFQAEEQAYPLQWLSDRLSHYDLAPCRVKIIESTSESTLWLPSAFRDFRRPSHLQQQSFALLLHYIEQMDQGQGADARGVLQSQSTAQIVALPSTPRVGARCPSILLRDMRGDDGGGCGGQETAPKEVVKRKEHTSPQLYRSSATTFMMIIREFGLF